MKEIIYDIIYGLLAGIALVAFIYFASKFQMKGWLTEVEKFLINQHKSTKKEKDDTEKK
jgi:hypothetical protein